MTAKEYLQQAYIAHGELEIKLEQINRLQALATRTTTTLKSTPCGSSVSGSKIESAVIRIQEEMDWLAGEVQDLLAIQENVSTAIKHVENFAERKILEYRYLCFFSWQQISLLMKISRRQLYRLHTQALENFSLVLAVNDTKCH